jgi:hypothetical protein
MSWQSPPTTILRLKMSHFALGRFVRVPKTDACMLGLKTKVHLAQVASASASVMRYAVSQIARSLRCHAWSPGRQLAAKMGHMVFS